MILTTKGLCQPPFPQQEGPRGGGGGGIREIWLERGGDEVENKYNCSRLITFSN